MPNKEKYEPPNPQRKHNLMSQDECNSGKKSCWAELELRGQIKNISPSVWSYVHLRVLYLNGNQLSRIPPDIAKLVNLQYLDMSHNKLRTLPAEMGDMVELRELYLSNNLLRLLPFELGKLFQLQKLGLNGNPLPPDIQNIYDMQGTSKLLQHMIDNLRSQISQAIQQQSHTPFSKHSDLHNSHKMGRSKRKVKGIVTNETQCENCREAQKQMLALNRRDTKNNNRRSQKVQTKLNKPVTEPLITSNLSYTCQKHQDSSDSEDSAIDTASLSDSLSISSDYACSAIDSLDQASACDSQESRTGSVEVSVKEVREEILDLESLAKFVTGVPLQKFTNLENCQDCFDILYNDWHLLQHYFALTSGQDYSFHVDLTGKDIVIHVDYPQGLNNEQGNNFFVTPQGATYYTSALPNSNLSDLPKETMIPPSERTMFDATHPPQRPWVPLAHPERNKPTALFTVMCYNVLCDKYCTRQLYGYSPSWSLHWDYRKKGILEEIRHYNADVISLQEVETEQFWNFFSPELEKDGYEGIFSPKSRARTMHETERKYVDGCAIFWKTHKFELNKQHLIEFNQLAIANAEGSENILNRVMTKDNIGLCALLETKEEIWENGNPPPEQVKQPILIATAHVVWDPEFCDVKLIQSMMLMSELKRIVENSQVSLRPGASKIDCTQIPMILCADLNSLPDSGVVEFLKNGKVSMSHLDFKEIDYEQVLNSFSHTKDNDYLTHGFKLKEAYDHDIMEYTNYTYDFKGTIDYVFYSDGMMNPLGVLGSMDKEWFKENKVVGCPHPHIPSDHFSLLVEFELPASGTQRNSASMLTRR